MCSEAPSITMWWKDIQRMSFSGERTKIVKRNCCSVRLNGLNISSRIKASTSESSETAWMLQSSKVFGGWTLCTRDTLLPTTTSWTVVRSTLCRSTVDRSTELRHSVLIVSPLRLERWRTTARLKALQGRVYIIILDSAGHHQSCNVKLQIVYWSG